MLDLMFNFMMFNLMYEFMILNSMYKFMNFNVETCHAVLTLINWFTKNEAESEVCITSEFQ